MFYKYGFKADAGKATQNQIAFFNLINFYPSLIISIVFAHVCEIEGRRFLFSVLGSVSVIIAYLV